MSGTLIWTDRLRIERAVWTLNSYLQTLPWRSQVSKRRELRVNLRAASADVGTKEALRRLGNVRTMAADYIIAEYGGPTGMRLAPTPSPILIHSKLPSTPNDCRRLRCHPVRSSPAPSPEYHAHCRGPGLQEPEAVASRSGLRKARTTTNAASNFCAGSKSERRASAA